MLRDSEPNKWVAKLDLAASNCTSRGVQSGQSYHSFPRNMPLSATLCEFVVIASGIMGASADAHILCNQTGQIVPSDSMPNTIRSRPCKSWITSLSRTSPPPSSLDRPHPNRRRQPASFSSQCQVDASDKSRVQYFRVVVPRPWDILSRIGPEADRARDVQKSSLPIESGRIRRWLIDVLCQRLPVFVDPD